jgi:uncharacterized OsmC-like protein
MSVNIHETMERFRSDRSGGKIAPAVSATLANGHTRISAGNFNFECDLPPSIGGGNQAPSPTAYLLGALAGCAVSFIANTLAPQFGVELDNVTAVARCESDLAGLLGMDDADPSLRGLGVEITIESSSPAEQVAALKRAWVERCPVYLSLVRANDVDVRFT